MTLSIVIPHFRQARFLRACLESVLAQQRVPGEVIVVDSSPDETPAVVAPFLDRIIYLRQPASGVAAARNAGIRASRGGLVAFLDADNEALPGCAERQWKTLVVERPDAVLCHGGMLPIDADGLPWPGAAPWRSMSVPFDEQLGWLLERNQIATDTVCVRRDVLERVGGFCEQTGVREDYDLWLRLSTEGPFAYIDEPLVRYRRHETNLSNDEASMFAWEAGALRRVPPDRIRPALARRLGTGAAGDLAVAEMLLRSGRHEEAEQAIEAGLVRWPEVTGFAVHAATLRFDAGHVAEAEALLRAAIERHLEPTAVNNLGVCLAWRGKTLGAAAAFSRALSIQPLYRDARHNLACLDRGDLAACRLTRRRMRRDPLPLT